MSLLYDWLARAAAAHSLDKALLADGSYLSWRGLLKRADDRARELQRMGIGKGDWVGLQLGNSNDLVILALGVSKLGAVVVPIHAETDSRTLHHLRDTFALRAVVVPSLGRPPEIRSSVGAERLRGTMLWCLSFERSPSSYRPSGEGELALVLFETDSLRRWRAEGRMAESLERTANAVIEHFDVDDTQPLLSSFPATAAIAWDLALLPALRAGATLVLRDDPSAKADGRALHRETGTGFEASFGLAATQPVGDWSPPVPADASRLHDQAEVRFKEIASEQLCTPLDSLIPEARFIEDFGADPCDIEEMFEALVGELGVALTGELDPDKIGTVGDALSYIRSHLLEKQAGPAQGFDGLRGLYSGDRVPNRGPVVSQQYVFAHRALPARFYREPPEFIALLEVDEEYLSFLWEIVGEDTGSSADAEVRAVIAKTPDDSALALIALPLVVERGDAIFVAMVAPAASQGKPPRYITLENAGRETMLCEWDHKGRHRNHGEGPEPDLTAFTEAVLQLL